MNIHNDPDDFFIADAIVQKLADLPEGTITTIGNLFDEVAPGFEDEDVDLSSIDFEVRRRAQNLRIALLTLPEFRVGAMGKVYNIPFKVKHMNGNSKTEGEKQC